MAALHREPSAEVEPEDAGRQGELMQAMFKILMTVLSALFFVLAFLEFEQGGSGASNAVQMNSVSGLRASVAHPPFAGSRGLAAHDITADSGATRTAIAQRNVTVMAGPSLRTKVVAKLLVGQQVETAANGVLGWEIVVLPDGQGYVPAAALAVMDDAADQSDVMNASLDNPA